MLRHNLAPTIELKENLVFFRLLERNKKNTHLRQISQTKPLEYDIYPKEKLDNSKIDLILRNLMGVESKKREEKEGEAGMKRVEGGMKAIGSVAFGAGGVKRAEKGEISHSKMQRSTLHFTIKDDFLILKRLSSFQNADGSFSFKSISLKELSKTLGKSTEEIENRFCFELKTLRNKDLLKIEQFVEKGGKGRLVFEERGLKEIRREDGERRKGMGFLMEAAGG